MAIELLYFAGVREAIGRSAESVSPPPEVISIADLVAWLASRGGGYAEAFADPDRIRDALGAQFAAPHQPIAGAREIALFPPVTGG